MRRLWIIAAALFLLGATLPKSALALSKGAVVEGSAEYLGVTVPLPPGKWEVVDTVTIKNPGYPNFPIKQAVLASRSGNVVDRVTRIWVQQKLRSADWFNAYHPCDADGYFFSVVKENTGKTLDCWHVREVSLGLDGSPEAGTLALTDYGKSNGLFVPVVMIGARFARLQDPRQRFYVEYLWTPDLLVAADTENHVWLPDDWTSDAVKSDPRKTALVETIIAWAKDWRERIH